MRFIEGEMGLGKLIAKGDFLKEWN